MMTIEDVEDKSPEKKIERIHSGDVMVPISVLPSLSSMLSCLQLEPSPRYSTLIPSWTGGYFVLPVVNNKILSQ